MTTRPVLVTFLSRKMLIFGDETRSRHLFVAENALFRRRDLFSSPFCGRKRSFSTTRLVLVTFLSRKTPYFDDETYSRHHFEQKNSIF
ncbi:hypothetical protein LI012_16455 [Caldibacillus thermoamylovorans]|uniref:hypothetical protein n=1 Tax=Caldibacillus thermoamylovorans TaxID=35841 RepID=UPI001D076370|nr:hypothetical protein [Caldibacillus thermoamylovorans]MCB5933538.1 hypothetical protein [Bacillus sp. DFI.2.34]MCB7078381.1 hypothetical protein [Caldibacillus thermoamylovorans]